MEKKLLVLGMAAMMAAGAANAELQAFKVNGETVSVAQQKALYDSAVAQGQPAGAELERQVKNVLTQQTVLLQEAKKAKLDRNSDVKQAIEAARNLRNEMFIKWKPTILYWIFGGILVYGNIAGRNFIRMLLSKAEIEMPGHAWGTLQNMWIGFFAAMGVVNLLVAYLCSTDTWVNFKLFGLMGLTLVFTIGIGVFMTKHAVTRQN